MANIGNLALMLSVNPTEFTAGLNKAMREIESFASKAAGVLGLGGPTAAIGGLLSLGGLGAAIGEGIASMAETARSADRLGISMRDMAAFQILAGGASEQMNHALGRLNATIGGARAGSEEAAKKLSAVGLAAKDFAGKNTADAYRTLSDAIARIPDSAQRAFVAHELLGRGGAELVGVLQRGSAALDQAADKAQAYGLVLDRQVAQRAIDAEKAISALGLASKALGQQLAAEALPSINILVNGLNAIAQHPGAFAKVFFTGGLAGMEELTEAYKKVLQQNAALSKIGQRDENAIAMGVFIESLDKAQKEMQFELDTMGMGANMKKALKLQNDALGASERKLYEEFKLGAAAFDEEVKAMERHKKALETMEGRTSKILDENMSELSKFRHEIAKVDELVRQGFLGPADAFVAMKRNADAFRDKLGLGAAPGVVSAQEAGGAAAQQTLAQADARNAFAWTDDLKSLLMVANQINEENGRKLQEWLNKNQEVLAASF
jgi:hypothetical protein